MAESKDNTPYLVLARKYRPHNFSELIGQDALVRTLTNAIAMDRVAHAFMLTGVRGIGKTTTARILALSFNCIGKDGAGSVTAEPCGECTHCTAIAEGRHMDVLELDAASKNKVEDIRDIIDSVQYAPTSARYKVYIIDEVHMLSKSAFNALLKTLEEPPAHVKFIFATTEINKVPVTILSRCQRFDLQRIDSDTLQTYFMDMLEKEKIEAEDEAIALIAKAADGSVRDGLSLMDRAISLADGGITAKEVQTMLGLSDRSQLFDLFEALIGGKVEDSLNILDKLYVAGGDPQSIIKDLLSITHLLTKGKTAPDTLEVSFLPETEKVRGQKLITELSIPALTRLWQILFKGHEELKIAPSMQQALEMILIRASYAAKLPLPNEMIELLKKTPQDSELENNLDNKNIEDLAQKKTLNNEPESTEFAINNFRELANIFKDNLEMLLYNQIYNFMTPIKFEQGMVEICFDSAGDSKTSNQVAKKLFEWTGIKWVVSTVSEQQKTAENITLAEEDKNNSQEKLANAVTHPIVKEVLEIFPGAKITNINDINIKEG